MVLTTNKGNQLVQLVAVSSPTVLVSQPQAHHLQAYSFPDYEYIASTTIEEKPIVRLWRAKSCGLDSSIVAIPFFTYRLALSRAERLKRLCKAVLDLLTHLEIGWIVYTASLVLFVSFFVSDEVRILDLRFCPFT
jgi:hypothetical protein